MKTQSSLLVGFCALCAAVTAPAQEMSHDMGMPANTLFVAQLSGNAVAEGSPSKATGTGAFVLDAAHHTMSYRLTYQGLESGQTKSIAIYHFGRGRSGPVYAKLCGGDGVKPCPAGNAATISGTVGDGRAMTNATISEFDSERMYVEIADASGKPTIRGQLTPNSAMVSYENYIADLGTSQGGKASGTAVLTEVHVAPDKTVVFYTATVANASGPPLRASLLRLPASGADRIFKTELALPGLKISGVRTGSTGGTLTGTYDVEGERGGPLAAKLLSTGKVGIVITTDRHPTGELFGTFEQVH